MQFTNVFLAAAYFFFTANPMVANAQCSPDFGNRNEASPGYVFEDANNQSSVLTRSGGTLEMAPFLPGPVFNQQFSVTCNDCEATSATGCTIRTIGFNPQCDGSQTFEFEESGTA
ncbi:hypothetical protein MPER_06919 [Moniliophthora perniciosa FA553]|nr:hypothetical protein MPER_06919 [Moniliophthora perniciosa FA553]